MPEIFNLHDRGESDRSEERPGWRGRDASVGKRETLDCCEGED